MDTLAAAAEGVRDVALRVDVDEVAAGVAARILDACYPAHAGDAEFVAARDSLQAASGANPNPGIIALVDAGTDPREAGVAAGECRFHIVTERESAQKIRRVGRPIEIELVQGRAPGTVDVDTEGIGIIFTDAFDRGIAINANADTAVAARAISHYC